MNADADAVEVERFESVLAPGGNVLLSFVGRARLAEGARAWIREGALSVARGRNAPLRFVGLPADLARNLARAPRLFVYREFGGRGELTEAALIAPPGEEG